MNGTSGSTEDIYRQRLDDAYYLRRMRDILQDGTQPRPVFPCEMVQLNEHLFIGNQKNAEDLDELVNVGITHVINCAPSRRRASCPESPYPIETGVIGFKVIPAEDREDYEISKHFDETFVYLERVKQVKGKALVHCNMGVNRSGAIAAAYLMVSECRCLFDVITFLKEKRKIVLTNKGFRRQLIRYARMKRLLDPISNDYYARRVGEFERLPLMDNQNAFSTPQLRRYPPDQKPPRIRHRSCRSRAININPQVSAPVDQDLIVRSLPRDMSRSRNDVDRQWQESLASSNPMTRRSISYIVRNVDAVDDESDKYSRARSYQFSGTRKSIAVDHILLPTTLNSSDASRRHDDIPRLEVKPSLGRRFSSRFNLTISSPSDSTKNWRNEKKPISPRPSNQTVLDIQTPPIPTANNPESRTPPSGGIKSRYCKQIRQHFSGLIDLIRPSINKSVASSTPKSNQLTFPIPLPRSESRIVQVTRAPTVTNESYRGKSGSELASTPTSANCTTMITPRLLPFQFISTYGSVGALNGKAIYETRPLQIFSTELNHIVRTRNQPTEQSGPSSKGSLVHIGTRTTALHPNYGASPSSAANYEAFATPRRLRRYVRSKTDSEIP